MKTKPSKKAEIKFKRMLRTYRKNNKYLTEDENSSESLNLIESCPE